MKAYRVFGIALVTGTDAEMDKLDKLAKGTHHLKRYPRVTLARVVKKVEKGNEQRMDKIAEALNAPNVIMGERVADMETTGDSNTFDADKVLETMADMEDKPVTLYGTSPAIARMENIDIHGSLEPPTAEEMLKNAEEATPADESRAISQGLEAVKRIKAGESTVEEELKKPFEEAPHVSD